MKGQHGAVYLLYRRGMRVAESHANMRIMLRAQPAAKSELAWAKRSDTWQTKEKSNALSMIVRYDIRGKESLATYRKATEASTSVRHLRGEPILQDSHPLSATRKLS